MRVRTYVRLSMKLHPTSALSYDSQFHDVPMPPGATQVEGVAILTLEEDGSWRIDWVKAEEKLYHVIANAPEVFLGGENG